MVFSPFYKKCAFAGQILGAMKNDPQQEIKMTQSITTMHILTRIYYLKQIQQMETFLSGLELNLKTRTNVIEEEENDGKTPTERAKMA